MNPIEFQSYLIGVQEQFNTINTLIDERINEDRFESPAEYRSFKKLIDEKIKTIGEENSKIFLELKIGAVARYEPIQRRDVPTREVAEGLVTIIASLDAQCRTVNKLVECRTKELLLLLEFARP